MTRCDLQAWGVRLEELGKSLATRSPENAQRQLTILATELSFAMIPGDCDFNGQEGLSAGKAIQGVTAFNRSNSPVKLELWGRHQGKYFVVHV